MDYLKELWAPIEKLLLNRTAAIKKLATDIYKESYLWLGPGLEAFMTGLKDP